MAAPSSIRSARGTGFAADLPRPGESADLPLAKSWAAQLRDDSERYGVHSACEPLQAIADLLAASLSLTEAPRALIDVNRALDELHPAAILHRHGEAPTLRSRAGLGLIPTRLGGVGELWRGAIAEEELARRIGEVHAPYHDAIAERLQLSGRLRGSER